MCSADVSNLPKAFQLVQQLAHLARDKPSEEYEEEQRMMLDLESLFEVHRPPPVVMGSGRTTIGNNFVCIMHAPEVGPACAFRCFEQFVTGFVA